MRSGFLRWILLALLPACAGDAPAQGPEPAVLLQWSRNGDDAFALRLGSRTIGELRPTADGFSVTGPSVSAVLRREEEPLTATHPYPRRVRIEGHLDGAPGYRDAFTLLAPPAPLPVEGYGLEVGDDAPGTNTREHEALRRWLAAQGLPADTAPFQALHQRETGRELRVFYEISGRRTDGVFERIGADAPAARVDSLFRSEDGRLKIHHQRPGENGRFTYHRQSLELADAITTEGEPDVLLAHQCGCYGYAIAADFMTLGDVLYQVEADWLDDRVGAEFFVGFEARERFPWIGLGDRLRMRNLARRARAFRLRDAAGVPFAEVTLSLPDDPPAGGLGPIAYHVERWDAAGERRTLARIEHRDEGIRLALRGSEERFEASLDELDLLLAAMPVQVMRGDGIRDSHLQAVERLVDAVRLLQRPGPERLADLVSDVDAAGAARKVRALLAPEAARFQAAAGGFPPVPIPGPASRQVGAGRGGSG